jgi:hypothetical protein
MTGMASWQGFQPSVEIWNRPRVFFSTSLMKTAVLMPSRLPMCQARISFVFRSMAEAAMLMEALTENSLADRLGWPRSLAHHFRRHVIWTNVSYVTWAS